MLNIKPISDLRNYSKLLAEVTPGNPVYLTRNGYGRYVIFDIRDVEKHEAASRLMAELDRAHSKADEKGWIPWEDVKKELGLTDEDRERKEAAARLVKELERARNSGEGTPWEDVKKELGLTDEDEERREAAARLMAELDKARNSGGKKTLEEVERELGLYEESEERKEAVARLTREIEEGRRSGKEKGFYTAEEVRAFFREKINPAVYAMDQLQQEMNGEAERTGLTTEESVVALVKEIRDEK